MFAIGKSQMRVSWAVNQSREWYSVFGHIKERERHEWKRFAGRRCYTQMSTLAVLQPRIHLVNDNWYCDHSNEESLSLWYMITCIKIKEQRFNVQISSQHSLVQYHARTTWPGNGIFPDLCYLYNLLYTTCLILTWVYCMSMLWLSWKKNNRQLSQTFPVIVNIHIA